MVAAHTSIGNDVAAPDFYISELLREQKQTGAYSKSNNGNTQKYQRTYNNRRPECDLLSPLSKFLYPSYKCYGNRFAL
jgi:hypothetical protein